MTDSSTRFHFTSTPPSAQLIADIQSLNTFDLSTLETFSSVLLAFLGQNPSQEELLQKFVAENPPLKSKARPLLTSVLHFFAASMRARGGATPQRVQSDLQQLGLSSERAELLSSGFLSQLTTLSEAAIDKTLHVNQLYDIQWKFGVSASSSELNQMGSCFLQLQLTVEKGEGKKENVLMELSLPQFYQFLQQMQLANRQMQALSK